MVGTESTSAVSHPFFKEEGFALISMKYFLNITNSLPLQNSFDFSSYKFRVACPANKWQDSAESE